MFRLQSTCGHPWRHPRSNKSILKAKDFLTNLSTLNSYNILDFSHTTLSADIICAMEKAELHTIRKINLSTTIHSNEILESLYKNNIWISLEKINVQNSECSAETLKLLHQHNNFSQPLIRDVWEHRYGSSAAVIYVLYWLR